MVPVLILSYILLQSNTIFCQQLQFDAEDGYFPVCLTITDIFPYPFSILAARPNSTEYSLQITFSRPVSFGPTVLSSIYLTPILHIFKDNITYPIFRHYRSYGSGRTYTFTFNIPLNTLTTPKVYLIVRNISMKELLHNLADYDVLNNGDEYCSRYSRDCFRKNTRYFRELKGPSRVVGEYYIQEYLTKNERRYQTPTPRPVEFNPLCILRKKRPLYYPFQSNVDFLERTKALTESSNIYVIESAYLRVNVSNDSIRDLTDLLTNSTPTYNQSLYVYLSISLQGQRSIGGLSSSNYQITHRIKPPSVIKATSNINDINVTVTLLPPNITIEVVRFTVHDPRIYIPTKIKTIYHLRDTILSNNRRSREETFSNLPFPKDFSLLNEYTDTTRCPADSRRNQYYTMGPVQYFIFVGSFYHLLLPNPPEEWRDNANSSIGAFLIDKYGGTRNRTSVIPLQRGPPEDIQRALSKYLCILPSTDGLTYSNLSKNWIHLDKCIFVPYDITNISTCGGLLNDFAISEELRYNLCDQKFSECAGMPFDSINRFPPIPTYGLNELTGWTECGKKECGFLSPVQKTSEMDNNRQSYSRSILKFSYTFKSTLEKVINSPTIILNKKETYSRSNVLIFIDYSTLTVLLPELSISRNKSCDNLWSIVKSPISFSASDVRSVNLTATVFNYGKGGADITFTIQCSDFLLLHPSAGVIKRWIEPQSNVTASFKLSSKAVNILKKAVHSCNMSIDVPSYDGDNIKLSCSKYIYSYYGFFSNPCFEIVEIPTTRAVYHILPPSHSKSILSSHHVHRFSFGMNHILMRGITIFLTTSESKNSQIRRSRSHSVFLNCSDSIAVVDDEYLALLRDRTVSDPRNYFQYDIVAPTKQVFFFLSKKAREKDVPLACFLELVAKQPNGYCIREKIIVHRSVIPLTEMIDELPDNERLILGTNISWLSIVYGLQSLELYLTMISFILLTVFLSLLGTAGFICKCFCRRNIANYNALNNYRMRYQEAIEENEDYWETPAVYLEVPDQDSHYGPHFMLHDFQSSQPLNMKEIASLKLAGVLKYKDKKLPVVVGDIQYLFVNKKELTNTMWLHATSGLYLLDIKKCAPAFLNEYRNFLDSSGAQ